MPTAIFKLLVSTSYVGSLALSAFKRNPFQRQQQQQKKNPTKKSFMKILFSESKLKVSLNSTKYTIHLITFHKAEQNTYMSAAYASSVFCSMKRSHLVLSEREGGLIGLASVKKY